MNKWINVKDTYIRNTQPEFNFSLDTIVTLESKLIEHSPTYTTKSNTRIFFKIDSYEHRHNIQEMLNDENVRFIYRIAISDIQVERFSDAPANVNIEIHRVIKPWERGLGDYDIENTKGISWNNYKTDTPWTNKGGDIDYNQDYLIIPIDLIGDNMEEYFYIDLDITDLVKDCTYNELINNGFLIKFDDDVEMITKNIATFNFQSALNTKATKPIVSGLYVTILEENIFDTPIESDHLLTENMINDMVVYVDNLGSYDVEYPILLNVKLLDSSINSDVVVIPDASTSYKIVDYYSNITIIEPDFDNNTIKYKNGKLYFELDPSIFKSHRKYKFIPIWVTTDTKKKIVNNKNIIFDIQ